MRKRKQRESQSMKEVKTYQVGQELFRDVAKLIDDTRKSVSYTINYALTYLYWMIGKRINEEILQYERAEYGAQIVASLTQQLQNTYGKGFDKSNLTRMMSFALIFPDEAIVVSLIQQLLHLEMQLQNSSFWSNYFCQIPYHKRFAIVVTVIQQFENRTPPAHAAIFHH